MDDSFVPRRSGRSNAGNRMHEEGYMELRAEVRAETEAVHQSEHDGDGDDDFVLTPGTDQQDIADYDSDFEDLEEDEAGDEQQAARAEQAVYDDECRQRKTGRLRVKKATAAAAARQRVTFNPEAFNTESVPAHEPPKQKRRVSLGIAIDAETGAVISSPTSASPAPQQRQSARALAQQARTASLARLAEGEKRLASTPKKSKAAARAPSQAELIARALDAEEGNMAAHRNYLAIEEERRRKAHVKRPAVTGPLLRWVSRCEETRVQISEPAAFSANDATTVLPGPSSAVAVTTPAPPPLTETVARQYVVHEISQDDDAPDPTWSANMRALFGTHCDWDNARVYVSEKDRPMSRYIPPCSITGLPARYLDPRTGAPFANVEAYGALTKVLEHEYAWSAALGCYTSVSQTLLPEERGSTANMHTHRSRTAVAKSSQASTSMKDMGKDVKVAPIPDAELPTKRGPGCPRKSPLATDKSD